MTEKTLAANSGTYRVTSIDVLRGIVMLMMAIDHTRDYFHIDAANPQVNPLDPSNPAVFFTRWITHFCAPTFLFLSGVSAYLAALKRSKAQASMFLITRGIWLIIVDAVIMTFGITFNPHFNLIVFQVIWAIGASMILLGLISRISVNAVLITGLILFFGHNLIDPPAVNGIYHLELTRQGAMGHLWDLLLRINVIPLNQDHNLIVLYSVLPWAGAMFIGYGIGRWFTKEFPPATRQRYLVILGLSMITLFIVLRVTDFYGNPTPWIKRDDGFESFLTFLDTNKYPPSLQYLCMTIGPSCLALAAFDNVRNRFTRFVSVYGQVPFFYYVLHFYLLHVILVIFFFAKGYPSSQIPQNAFPPIWFRVPSFGYDLPIVYLVWLGAILILYLPCRWFGKYKKTHKQWWLSYV